MIKNVAVLHAVGGYPNADRDDPRDFASPSFAVVFAFMRDAAYYASELGNQAKRRRYWRYVAFDIAIAMESLHLALSEMEP